MPHRPTAQARHRHRAKGETWCETCGDTAPAFTGRGGGRPATRPHGTASAVRRHEYRREPCCSECLPVQRQLSRDRRAGVKTSRAAVK